MKKYIFTLVFAALCLTIKAQVYYSDGNFEPGQYDQKKEAERERILKSHIGIVRAYRYEADSGKEMKGNHGFLAEEDQYDDKGNLIDYKNINRLGRITDEFLYRFDDKGRCVESTRLNRNGKINIQWTYAYDKNGNMTDMHTYSHDPSGHMAKKYDDKNRLVEQTWYWRHDSRVGSHYKYSYYDDGSKKQTVEYSPKGKILHTWNYDCSPVGKLATPKFKDTTKVCVRYETDKNGNQIKIKEEFVKRGSEVRSVNKYDLHDNLIDMAGYDIKGNIVRRSSVVFNDHNQATEYIAYKKKSNTVSGRLVYEYDPNGNIIKLLTYKGVDKPKYVVKYNYLAAQ